MNVRSLVLRGAAAGAIAGLLAFVFARVFAEPLIQAAIDYESARDEAGDALARAAGQSVQAADPDLFSRGVQTTLGVGVGIVAVGVAFGLLVAVVYALGVGRVGRIGPRGLAMLVALGGFVTLYLVPFMKYPANPPAIGHENTIADRSGLYLLMVAISVVVGAGAVWAGRRWQPRCGTWNATVLAALGFVVVIGVVMAVLPSLGQLAANADGGPPVPTETPLPLTDAAGHIVFPGFDADLLYQFRLYSVLNQLILWTALGLVFGYLVDRPSAREDAHGDTRPAAGHPVEVP